MNRSALALSLLCLLPACQKQQPAVPPSTAAVAGEGSTVVATVGGKPITMAEVDKAAGRDLFELRERTLDNLITERVLEPAAKAAGVSPEAYLRKEVESRVPEVPEKEAAA